MGLAIVTVKWENLLLLSDHRFTNNKSKLNNQVNIAMVHNVREFDRENWCRWSLKFALKRILMRGLSQCLSTPCTMSLSPFRINLHGLPASFGHLLGQLMEAGLHGDFAVTAENVWFIAEIATKYILILDYAWLQWDLHSWLLTSEYICGCLVERHGIFIVPWHSSILFHGIQSILTLRWAFSVLRFSCYFWFNWRENPRQCHQPQLFRSTYFILSKISFTFLN